MQIIYAEQIENIRGVANSNLHLYKRENSNWRCLDGSAIIPHEAINDDYCDCADGSDEPGTSACLNGRFYCKNIGHIPSYIPSSRVNDGVCEPECCDGSDEYDGKVQCPNVCKKVGEEYRKHVEGLIKIQTEGVRKKQEYIEYGRKLREEREANLNRLKTELEAAKTRVQERLAALKKAQDAEKNHALQTNTKETNHLLHEKIELMHNQIKALLDILKNLKSSHNPNYHDLAVTSAIKEYDDFKEEYGKNMGESLDIEEEIKPKYSYWNLIIETSRVFVNDVLEAFGLADYAIDKSESDSLKIKGNKKESKDVSAAQDAYNSAHEEQTNIEKKINEIQSKLSMDYGKQDEFAKLDGECFTYNSGEYTYTVCMLESVKQKSNNDHSSSSLGNFIKWNGAESKDDPKYYMKQLYDNGTRCWNGPNRSAKIHFECGKDNEILSVAEPAKCEYLIKMTTPAVCHKIDIQNNKLHEEL
ncbi:7729_t:CDS:10 [Entrophospora sp. SA101]|nr:7729_t:CDS:10 [Entrophospora sp. SA101]